VKATVNLNLYLLKDSLLSVRKLLEIQKRGRIMSSQLRLNIYKGKRGGRRSGAGRKRIHSKGVAHRTRETVITRHALHINFKMNTSIRNKRCLKILKRAIKNSRSMGLSIAHFSLQSNHLHLIVEAKNNAILTRGMRSLTITFSKGIGRGRIQLERYHLHVLKTIRETRNAVHYVLFNEQKHSGLKRAYVNSFSSLGVVQDLRELAKKAKMMVILGRIQEDNFLDTPEGWMLKQVLNQQIC
jgi:REP element-mobilizing transposase RayT